MHTRTCPECGERFTTRYTVQVFCSPKHQTAFHNRAAKRGKVLVPLMMAWRQGRSTEAARRAFTEACAKMSDYAAEDKAAGRKSMHDFVRMQYGACTR